jgi:hypothetical protein
MFTNNRQVIRARLLANDGFVLPGYSSTQLNKGWYEPNNPASCYRCGLLGPCSHDLFEKVPDGQVARRFKHTKAIADAGHKVDGQELVQIGVTPMHIFGKGADIGN